MENKHKQREKRNFKFYNKINMDHNVLIDKKNQKFAKYKKKEKEKRALTLPKNVDFGW